MIKNLETYFDRLWPLNRSLTGNDTLKSLQILSEITELNLHYLPSGTKVFDWEIPQEWNITDAYIICPDGKIIADFKVNNLHVVGYSIPINTRLAFHELKKHLHYHISMPDAIPYVTSYYKQTWGFCISYNQYLSLPQDGIYSVVINASLKAGKMHFADCFVQGSTKNEIFFSTYICHPSMANNELSGMLVTAMLCKEIKQRYKNPRYSYRFIFVPETIGAIAYLSENGNTMKQQSQLGFVITCVGDNGKFTFKKTKKNDAYVNKLMLHLLEHLQPENYQIEEFSPIGSDERQYTSPGFDFDTGSLMRSMYGKYAQYHTSEDNKQFISFHSMKESIEMYLKIVEAIELDGVYENTIKYGEPQLSKRNLYPTISDTTEKSIALKKILFLLNYSDGKTSLLDIAIQSHICILDFQETIATLSEHSLLVRK